MGHSSGEIVAACIAGVFSMEDGLKLICERGRLMDNLPQLGSMSAIFDNEDKVRALITSRSLEGRVCIAAVNGSTSVVISGITQDVETLCNEFQHQGVSVTKLDVSNAFHSPLMEPILQQFQSFVAPLKFSVRFY